MREGDDLITALDVAAPLAALGATLQMPTLEGTASIEVPPGTQPGEVLTLRGEGMPALQRGRRGDLRVVVNVVIPRRLSEQQRELLEQLNGTLTEENLRSEESMFAKLRRTLRGRMRRDPSRGARPARGRRARAGGAVGARARRGGGGGAR